MLQVFFPFHAQSVAVAQVEAIVHDDAGPGDVAKYKVHVDPGVHVFVKVHVVQGV